MAPSGSSSKILLAVFVAALGYFVDAYDIMLFSIIRTKSLLGIGVPESELFNTGLNLFNWQSAGLLLGGIFWGSWATKGGVFRCFSGPSSFIPSAISPTDSCIPLKPIAG